MVSKGSSITSRVKLDSPSSGASGASSLTASKPSSPVLVSDESWVSMVSSMVVSTKTLESDESSADSSAALEE